MKELINKGKLVVPTPVRFTEKSDLAINKACEKTGLSKQDLIRLATDIGLTHLEKIEYNLANAVITASTKE